MAGDQFTIEEMKLGIDHILVEFLENICQVPETFTDFPINDELLKAYRARTTKEFRHAQLVLKKVPIFKALRSKLCPHTFNEDTFWSIYFRLTNNIIKDILRDVDDSSNVPLLVSSTQQNISIHWSSLHQSTAILHVVVMHLAAHVVMCVTVTSDTVISHRYSFHNRIAITHPSRHVWLWWRLGHV